jgi:NAD(P)-dependent dehydrogenase (short-subunit alcohol dehydrogenase family)
MIEPLFGNSGQVVLVCRYRLAIQVESRDNAQMKKNINKNQVIFITGCSSGIGFDAVTALRQRGHRVIASCRNPDDLTLLLQQGHEAVLMDMNQTESIQKGLAEVLALSGGRLDVLINNAGYGQLGALEDISRDVLRQQFETNVFGLMDLSRQVIPLMRQQGSGRIINMSSVLGLVSFPFRGAYNASKYAVEALCDTLRLELRGSGVDVICVEPGPIESHFRDNAVQTSLQRLDHEKSHFKTLYQKMLLGFAQQKSDSFFTQGARAVIQRFIHAIESPKPKAKYPVTLPTYLFISLKRAMSTRMLDRFLSYCSKKELNFEKDTSR